MDILALRSDIAALHSKIDFNSEKYMMKFNSIEEQTTKTNGRVGAVEKQNDEFNDFKNQAKGAIIIIMSLVIPMFVWFVVRYAIN